MYSSVRPESNSEYPVLKMFTSGSMETLVLFNAPKTGMVVYAVGNDQPYNKVGYYCTGWYEENFVKFNGQFEIWNY